MPRSARRVGVARTARSRAVAARGLRRAPQAADAAGPEANGVGTVAACRGVRGEGGRDGVAGACAVAGVRAVAGVSGREQVREDHRVLDGLAAALAEVGGHGVGGVAEPGDPAVVQAGQRRGQVVQVVLEDVGRVEAPDPLQQGRDRVVPRAEASAQFRAGSAGRVPAGTTAVA